jgi:O-antigen ligase
VLVALAVGAALAIVKAVLGLASVAAGRGTTVDGTAITYYEPAANWLMLVVLLGVLAAVLQRARDRLPLWLLVGSPLMVASLALSLRRSFWIGIALGGLLVVLLASSPAGRRLLLPTAVLVAVGVWLLGAVGFQAQGPLTARVESLQPSRLEVNAEERYRTDERANVLAELGAHPVTGLGLGVGWSSAARPLPVEHENGRQYVHTVALWYWLKLGLLGLAAYVMLVVSACLLAFRIWRGHPDRLLRAGGLAALCSLVAMAVVETTGSFTGVDPRFTILFAVFLGLLAAGYREARAVSS